MGLIIRSQLETDIGHIDSPYVVISDYKISKTSAEIGYRISYFTSKEYWKQSLPYEVSDLEIHRSLPLEARFSPSNVLYPHNDDGALRWVEVNFPQYFNIKLSEVTEVEVPIIEEKEVKKQIPYVTFDSEGNELIKYDEEIIIEKVEVGKEKVKKELIMHKYFDNPMEFAYNHLKQELSSLLPEIIIEDN